jgi:phage shock protein C
MSDRRLRRSSSDKVLAGVCGGIAEYFDIPAILVRLLFLFSGIGIVPYLLMTVLIPED